MKPGPSDNSRIDLSDDYEVEYWMIELGVSYEELTRVVRKVGPLVADVDRELA
jgi:hypothetical protein